jgi:lipopolysaccharide/colanic/teichoic acid biosynthesis glycosyltransferase
MPRIGKNGKIIGVYKFRTMHPYAEFLHDYILKNNGYASTGKPANDFRLTPWGKFFRKYWIDELPQLLNLIKGDLKIVGVRPVSKRYLEDIPEDLRKLRYNHKPGCIPPYVIFNCENNVESVLEAERKYLNKKNKNPITTDFICFFKGIWNILLRKKRSA